MKYLGAVPLYPRSHYARVLSPQLPKEAFEPARSRLLLVPVWLSVIAAAIGAVAFGWVPWFVLPVLSIVIGFSFAGLTFIGHEVLHGGMTHGKLRQHLIGFIGFLPFVVSPRLWTAWHNRAHHAHTNLPEDPDMYPSLEKYRANRGARFAVNAFSLGGRRWRGVLSLILGFTVQSTHQLVTARENGVLSRQQHRLAIGETLLGVVVWATVAWLVGFVPFLFVFVVPLLIANACVMAFILTNHALSPQVEINDPLISGLSVTTSRWIERLTLGFGYHVEHHLFPALSTRYARDVRSLIEANWPERYQSMPLLEALAQLHASGRVYKDAITLCDPMTGREFPTLMPGVRQVASPALDTPVTVAIAAA
ncbi:MAG TPA: fatty acid desaturase [Kofleriaceae bacterium]|jgi:fatty acid desaturase|nr:fatty acid desaturase [Kofleriaceae bacterium]